jgi:FkbM family methyltransferase
MKQILKDTLKRVPLLARTKRVVDRTLRSETSRAFQDDQYFGRKLSSLEPDNIGSLNPQEGVVRGRFAGQEYLLKYRFGSQIETLVYLDGNWEGYVLDLMASYLQIPNPVFVDIGANIGATTIPLAKRFPLAQFHLFEPHPAVLMDLRENLALNRVGNAQVHQLAISNSTDKHIPFYAQRQANNMGLSSSRPNADIGGFDFLRVPTATLDHVFGSASGKIDVIKIDTQGTEIDVLESASDVVAQHRPAIFFEFEDEYFESAPEKSQIKERINAFFARADYQLYGLNARLNFFPKLNLEGYYHGNIMALPKS